MDYSPRDQYYPARQAPPPPAALNGGHPHHHHHHHHAGVNPGSSSAPSAALGHPALGSAVASTLTPSGSTGGGSLPHHHHRAPAPMQQQQQQHSSQQQQQQHPTQAQHSSGPHSQPPPPHHHHRPSRPSQPQNFGHLGQQSLLVGGSGNSAGSFGGPANAKSGFEYSSYQHPSTSAAPSPPLAAPLPPTAPPRVALADRDLYMLSLPLQDSPAYYDSSDSATSDTEGPLAPLTTNRGNKLHSIARNARKGRLGSYPRSDLGFTAASAAKRRKTLDGRLALREGFAVAPNLHLVPRRSPSPPAHATLPPPPQSPLDLVLSTALQHTFSPKNATLKTLAMSTTGLIEQEGALIGSLRRVCAGLRGEGFEFRFAGDDEAKREREVQAERERLRFEVEHDRLQAKAAKAEGLAQAQAALVAEKEAEKENAASMAAEAEAAAASVADVPAASALLATAVEQEQEQEQDIKMDVLELAAEVEAAVEPVEVRAESAPAVAEGVDGVTLGDVTAVSMEGVEGQAPVKAELHAEEVVPRAPTPAVELVTGGVDIPAINITVDGVEEPAMVPGELVEAASAVGSVLAPANPPPATISDVPEPADEDHGDDLDEPATRRRRSGRVASRASDPSRGRSGSTSTDSDEPAAASRSTDTYNGFNSIGGVADEEMPEYAKRMVDPEVFVRSLFVTDGPVGVPISIQGGPPGSTDVDLLSPNEQEVMVHDCLTDLHRFMADSLEYRARLSEIRDGVLGIERRRKGMWKVVRMVAADWLEEESAAHDNE